ncbi:MAG: monovalent cation/H(+) antiporter subunit G [Planctomycetota bacterium]|jgi:multicomponent Na+:H+ antiporter subunit G
MSDIATVAAGVLIAAGLAFDIFGCIGLVRLPDVYTRLQAATKCVTLGTCLILLGALVGSIGTDSAGPMITKAVLCIAFVLITSPTAAHALARGAYKDGIKPSPSVVDEYAKVVPVREPDRSEAVGGPGEGATKDLTAEDAENAEDGGKQGSS